MSALYYLEVRDENADERGDFIILAAYTNDERPSRSYRIDTNEVGDLVVSERTWDEAAKRWV